MLTAEAGVQPLDMDQVLKAISRACGAASSTGQKIGAGVLGKVPAPKATRHLRRSTVAIKTKAPSGGNFYLNLDRVLDRLC